MVGNVIDTGTYRDIVIGHAGQVARAQVETGPRWQLPGVSQVCVLGGGIDGARVQGEARRARHIPFGTKAQLRLWCADDFLAIIASDARVACLVSSQVRPPTRRT